MGERHIHTQTLFVGPHLTLGAAGKSYSVSDPVLDTTHTHTCPVPLDCSSVANCQLGSSTHSVAQGRDAGCCRTEWLSPSWPPGGHRWGNWPLSEWPKIVRPSSPSYRARVEVDLGPPPPSGFVDHGERFRVPGEFQSTFGSDSSLAPSLLLLFLTHRYSSQRAFSALSQTG